jgi:2-hydroxy-6-oxonona-2,4-dienedioate hydrolase
VIPAIPARRWGPLPDAWTASDDWIGEWMTIGGETWFARIRPQGDPGMPPVVMIHGLVVSGAYFRPIAALLDDRYAVYVPDLPGHGRSRSKRHWSLASLTTQLAEWMDAHGLSGAVVVGNSLGCQTATLLATMRPDLVRALILIGPTLDPEVRSPLQLMLRGAIDIPRERQSLWTIWIPDLVRAGLRRSLFMLQQTFADDQLARLGEVRQPALVIGGEHDPIAPQSWVREMAARLPCGEAIVIPGASHALNYSNAADLVKAIRRVTGLPV